jgi:PKD repeat protein
MRAILDFVWRLRIARCGWSLSDLSLAAAIAVVSGTAYAGQVNLAWDAVASATGYRLYYGTATGSYGSNIDAKNVTSYTVAGLTDGTRYYFAVRAYNATTTSGYSTEINTVVGTATAPVASFTATPTSGAASRRGLGISEMAAPAP